MDVFKKYYEQLRDLFTGMSPGNRVTSGLLLAILLVSLVFLLVGVVRPGGGASGNTILLYDAKYFSTPEQIKVAEALGKAGLKYDWNEGRLEVPKKDADRYVAALADAGAVVNPGSYISSMVGQLGPYVPGKQMDMKDRDATSRTLEAALAQASWIQSATVVPHVRNEMERELFHRKQVISVMVHIVPSDDVGLTSERVSWVTAAVAPAFGVKDHSEIRVVDTKTGRHAYGNDLWALGGEQSYTEAQKQQERDWNRKFETLFSYINGLVVQTTVKISDVRNRREHDISHGKPTGVVETMRTTSFEKTGSDYAARPGFEAQMGTPELTVPQGRLANSTSLTEATEESEVAKALQGIEGTQVRAGFVPQSVMAVIQVPRSYFRDVWIRRNTTAEEPNPQPTPADLATIETEELARIRANAAKLLEQHRPAEILDAELQANVSPYDDKPEQPAPRQSTMQLLGLWLGTHWETLALLGLILVGLLALWSMTRVKQPEPIVIYEAPEIPLAEEMMSEEEIEEDEELVRQRTLEPFDKSMRSLQSEAADLVAENPDAAANVLRQWIGNVSFQE